jgi:preprotein translocase subunit YajC
MGMLRTSNQVLDHFLMATFYYFCWLIVAQIPPGGGTGESASGGTPVADRANDGIFGGWTFLLPALLFIMLLYFMLMLPRQQQKEKAKTLEMINNLKKNDRVVTAGGIIGTVINNREDTDYLTLRIDDNAKMQVLKQSVIRVLKDDEQKKKDE